MTEEGPSFQATAEASGIRRGLVEFVRRERAPRSVATLARRDGEAFPARAPRVPVRTRVQTFPLEEANAALARLRAGQLTGAAVLDVAQDVA